VNWLSSFALNCNYFIAIAMIENNNAMMPEIIAIKNNAGIDAKENLIIKITICPNEISMSVILID
jgi:hypothetical protein